MTRKTRLYLTRSEIFSAAWRRFRSVHGARATPRQHPNYWAACLRMMWQAAKGDAFVLSAIRFDAAEAARKSASRRNSPGRRSYSRGELRLPKRTTTLLPREVSDRYCLRAEGCCLEPIFFNDDPMLIDSKAEVGNGDFVAIWRRRDLVKPGEHQIIIKRLIRFGMVDGKWSAIVEMFNPQVRFAIPWRNIEAMHKCLGVVPKDMPRIKMTDDEFRESIRTEKWRAARSIREPVHAPA
jgi:hypothetical protein